MYQTYVCPSNSCSKNDLITGTSSVLCLCEVNCLVDVIVPSAEVASVKIKFSNISIKSASGTVAWPKQSVETTSMKKSSQLFIIAMYNFFDSFVLQYF